MAWIISSSKIELISCAEGSTPPLYLATPAKNSVAAILTQLAQQREAAPCLSRPAAEVDLPCSVQIIWQPQGHSRPQIHKDHAKNHDQHVRHHPRENLVQRHMLGR